MNSYSIFNLLAFTFGVILLSELSPIHASSTSQIRSSYGEACNKTARCTSGASLTCRNEVCDCVKPDTMTFNTELKKCVVNVNEICKYLVETENDMQKMKRFEIEQCIPNAECNEKGVCSCKNLYFENSNGSCITSGSRGDTCPTSLGCRTDLFLACVNRTCQCDPERSLLSPYRYNPGTKICAGLIGKPCLNEECVQSGYCEAGHCKCQSPFVSSNENGGTCDAVNFDHACSKRSDNRTCHSNFTCLNNQCKCKYHGTIQFYDNELKVCRSLVGGPCVLDGPSEQCAKNSICFLNAKTNFPECRCVEPYVPNGKGRCEDLGIDTPCSSADRHPSYAKCDQLVPLYCRDDKCSCVDDLMVYEPHFRKCKGLVGSICFEDDFCVQNATCKKFREGVPRGQCECINLENLTVNKTCDGHKSEK